MECVTRWSSLCVMIERLLHARVPITATLAMLGASDDKVPAKTESVPTFGVIFPVMQKLLSLHLDTTTALESRKARETKPVPATPIERFKAFVGDHFLCCWTRVLKTSTLSQMKKNEPSSCNKQNNTCSMKSVGKQRRSLTLVSPFQRQHREPWVVSSRIFLAPIQWSSLGQRKNCGNTGSSHASQLLYMMLFKALSTGGASIAQISHFLLRFSLAGWVVDKRRCSLTDSSIEDRLMVIANKKHLA